MEGSDGVVLHESDHENHACFFTTGLLQGEIVLHALHTLPAAASV